MELGEGQMGNVDLEEKSDEKPHITPVFCTFKE